MILLDNGILFGNEVFPGIEILLGNGIPVRFWCSNTEIEIY